MMHACLQGSQQQPFFNSLGAMSCPVSHFDHSFVHFHLVPLLTRRLTQVWNSISNTRRPRPLWIAKRDPDQAAESVEKDSEQMTHYIIHIVMLSQSWCCVDESTLVCKLLYDDAVLHHS